MEQEIGRTILKVTVALGIIVIATLAGMLALVLALT